MLVKTKGIVLKETPYSETSKVLNVLTSDYGLIGILSKGCKNMKSKLRGISNKMVYAEFTIKYKETGLSTLVEGNYINSFKNIFNDIKKANYSFYIMDLIYYSGLLLRLMLQYHCRAEQEFHWCFLSEGCDEIGHNLVLFLNLLPYLREFRLNQI